MLQNLSVLSPINYDRMASCEPNVGGPAVENIKSRTYTQTNKESASPHNSVKARFELLKTLGKGTYGKVKLAIDRTTGQKVAIKTILKDKVKERDGMKHILREMEIMRALKHPHIIQVYDVYQNQDRIVIVMEYAQGGELFDYLANQKSISEVEARSLFTQIVSAVQHCHRNGIVHRDLKLENILLGDHNEIKIADFGLANKYSNHNLLSTFCGSPLYASPEIINGIPYVGPEVDSWSLGVLLYSLVYCMMPFDGSDYTTLTNQISKGEFTKPSRHSDALGLIKELLQVDPKLRITVDDVTKHEWMQAENAQAKSISKPCSLDANGNIVYDKQSQDTTAHCDVNNEHKHKKSILKRKDSDQTSDSDSSILSNPLVHNIVDDAFGCGLHAKDSLKLKAKPHGSSHKRRVMRPKRDRESGYYSSPERNHELSALSPAGQVPVIKPMLTPHKGNRRASVKTRSHNSPQFEEMLENFSASIPRKNNDDCSTSLLNHKQSRPVTVPRSTVKRSRGSETPPEALTPTSAHLVAELQRILPSRDGAKHHRMNDVNIYNSYEYLPPNQTQNDNFSTELDAMMRQLNLELEEAYENAINIKSSLATV